MSRARINPCDWCDLPSLEDLVTRVTEDEYWTTLRADFDGAKVLWRSWGTRNPFLTIARFTTKAATALRGAVSVIAASGFLDFATGLGLELFAKSQYQLDKQDATFATGRIILDMSAVVAAAPFSAGGLLVGTPGPVTADSRLFTNVADGTLLPGEANVLSFTAQEGGDLYNLPVGAPIDLKTSIPGVTASLRASGPPKTIGLGNASIVVWAAKDGAKIEILDPGAASQALDVDGNLGTGTVTVSLATDSGGALISTAAQVRRAIATAIATPATNVGALLVAAGLGGDGTGIVQAAALTALDWTGTWIAEYGQNRQSDDSLKQDCETRFPTMGGGSGDGAPVSTAQTEDALIFWGKRPPPGYKRSPVEKIKVYTGIDDTGATDGAAVLVVLAGASGPLSPADVAAVAANFETPRKYSYGVTLRVISAEAYTVALTGAVTIRRSSGRSIAEVQAAITRALTTHQADPVESGIGAEIDDTKLRAVVIDADRAAIKSYAATAPVSPVLLSFKQVPVYDASALTYALS